MRIFVTGASGWIGSAVVPELISAGHQVLGLARSDASAKAVTDMGAEALRGDLNDTDALRAGTLDSDGVIHLAFVVPSMSEAATQTDAKAIETFVTGLAGTGKPLVISGATLTTPGRPWTERDELIAVGPNAARITNMQTALAAADRGVRSCLVMLPRSVHGQGERHGFVPSSSPRPGPRASPATSGSETAAGLLFMSRTLRACIGWPSGRLPPRRCSTPSVRKACRSARSPRPSVGS
jgi:nucleoside-diphosphate-sugar epimerase